MKWRSQHVASGARSHSDNGHNLSPLPAARSPQLTAKHQSGVTLVELIIAIVIISIASVALLQGLGLQTQRNVDPMIQSQAQALARQYLDEAMGRSFFDPSDDPRVDPSVNQADAVSSARDQTSSTADPTDRRAFDNVFEYDGFNQPVQTPNGIAVSALSGYTVAVEVDLSGTLSLGTISNPADTNVCPPKIMLITVTITDPRGQATSLSGYRTSYFANASRYAGC